MKNKIYKSNIKVKESAQIKIDLDDLYDIKKIIDDINTYKFPIGRRDIIISKVNGSLKSSGIFITVILSNGIEIYIRDKSISIREKGYLLNHTIGDSNIISYSVNYAIVKYISEKTGF